MLGEEYHMESGDDADVDDDDGRTRLTRRYSFECDLIRWTNRYALLQPSFLRHHPRDNGKSILRTDLVGSNWRNATGKNQ